MRDHATMDLNVCESLPCILSHYGGRRSVAGARYARGLSALSCDSDRLSVLGCDAGAATICYDPSLYCTHAACVAYAFVAQHRERKAQARGGSVVSRQTDDRRGNMEATSTVRTQTSDTVDIIRETPDRSASYTNVLKRRMRWVDIDAAMSHQEEEEDWIRTSQAVSCTTEPFIARIARAVTNVASNVAIDATALDRDRVP